MSLLLTEDSSFLATEAGNHILIEPVDFFGGFSGVATIIDKGAFWETDLGRGPIRSGNPDNLVALAKRAGALDVIFI